MESRMCSGRNPDSQASILMVVVGKCAALPGGSEGVQICLGFCPDPFPPTSRWASSPRVRAVFSLAFHQAPAINL